MFPKPTKWIWLPCWKHWTNLHLQPYNCCKTQTEKELAPSCFCRVSNPAVSRQIGDIQHLRQRSNLLMILKILQTNNLPHIQRNTQCCLIVDGRQHKLMLHIISVCNDAVPNEENWAGCRNIQQKLTEGGLNAATTIYCTMVCPSNNENARIFSM